MRRTRLIGLVGRAGVGKDTVAEMLAAHDYVRHSFAEPLRVMVEAQLRLHQFDTYWMADRAFKEISLPVLGHSVRRHMQLIGQALRADDEDYWVRCLAARAGLGPGRTPAASHIVISDLRFRNEAAWVREQGGVLVRVLRDAPAVAEHVSEQQVDGIACDLTVCNTSTLHDLRDQVRAVAETVERRYA